MILSVIILVFIIMKSARCSIVRDAFDPESIQISKYCPKQKYCEEGSHVVCMYYDENQEFSPNCGNPVKIEVTPKMIQSILANVNEIRGKVATGSEKGKDDKFLPRAYGLMKLEWDKELAFLAQVLANQCLGGREDSCRATDRFPNPSQNIAIIRYKYPNWEYYQPNNTEKGLNEGKVLFAFDRFLKTTHALKSTVTKEIIMKCPHFQELKNGNLKYYLNLVRGGATHIGCGVSAFSKYKMDGGTESIQNNVQIVCNISDAPKPKQAVYKIVPPISGQGYSIRCGCPIGFKESRSCLCEKDLNFQWKGNIRANNVQKKSNQGLGHKLMDDYDESIKNRVHSQKDEDIYDDIIMALNENNYPENKDRHTIGVDSLTRTSKSHSAEEQPEGKYVQNFESSEELSKINAKFTNEMHEPVGLFPSDTKSKSKNHKSIASDAFEELISNVQSYGEIQKSDHQQQKKDYDSKHKRLLSILTSLEHEVNNIMFDNDLKQLFDLKMRKIYENGIKKAKEIPSTRTLDHLPDKKELHELKTYLETENNASVEDEISTLRRMIHHLSKGKHRDHEDNYAEIDNNPNQNYNHMDQQFDEFHDINHMDHLYEDVSRKPALAEHRNNYIQFHDLLVNKHNHRQSKDNNNLHELRSEIRNQKTFADNNERHTFLSKAIGKNRGHRTSIDARVQFSQPFSRRNNNDDLNQVLLRRPNLLDTIRITKNKQKSSKYPSQRDTFVY